MNAPGTDWVLSEEGNRLYNRLRRFLSRPQEVGYLFMTATDERLMPFINQKLMQEVPGLGIFFWQDSDQPFVQQLLDFAATHSTIVVANLSGIARRQPTFLQSLNFAREQLNGLEKPIGFWLTPATLKQVANKAADLYSQRRYTILAFDDELPPETSPKITQSFVHEETEAVQAQIDLLKEQLKAAIATKRPKAEVAQAIALPLAQAYAEDGQGSKALELLSNYNESLNKENPENLFRIATVHEKAFDYEWAITYYKAAAQQYNHGREKAVSYERLGGIYQTQGELAKALDYFEKEVVLFEELYQANPRSETFKRDLAVSYEKLGGIYQTQGELAKALDYFEKYSQLGEELYRANPRSETFKRDLAVSYWGLGNLFREMGKTEKARFYFLKCEKNLSDLCKQLSIPEYEANLAEVRQDLHNLP